jgi:hypothetical protein
MSVGSVFHYFGPEEFGGLGDFRAKIEAQAGAEDDTLEVAKKVRI